MKKLVVVFLLILSGCKYNTYLTPAEIVEMVEECESVNMEYLLVQGQFSLKYVDVICRQKENGETLLRKREG